MANGVPALRKDENWTLVNPSAQLNTQKPLHLEHMVSFVELF
jgi:hypothetical protein